jgi:NAD-dependent SIR2 family protein deacetylase
VADYASASSFDRLLALVVAGDVVVLSGAGLSTESGIPDYRGATGRRRPATPMTYQEFVATPGARQRYWARSHLGWRRIGQSRPNAGHLAVATLEREQLVSGVITQNVDGLHEAAGSQRVVDLHGRLDRVRCLSCGELTSRGELDDRLTDANAGWTAAVASIKPDGDAEINAADSARFASVDCRRCGGILKPDVVFFGENVPRERVADCYAQVDDARVLLVLGSSLTVMSGLRFVRRAAKAGTPIAIVNQGETRGDELASVAIDAPLGKTLSELAGRLGHLTPTP